MAHGPNDTLKLFHADLSDRSTAVDTWADIARKTSMVVIVTFTTWVGCSLMRRGVELGSEGLFRLVDRQGAHGFWRGAGMLVAVMLIVGLIRGLLLLRPAWRDSEGDGIDKALVKFHQSYDAEGDDPASRYAAPTFSNAFRKIVMTVMTIGAGGSGGLEAPGVYLGESLGAAWSKFFKQTSADDLRLYQLSGIAAAIAVLLAAPFTAAIFAAEIVYGGRIVYRKLTYCLIAGVLAHEFSVRLDGHGSLFTAPGHSYVFAWQEYLLVILVAVGFSAPAAMALGPIIRGAERFFASFPVVARAAVGALITAVISVGMWRLFDIHPHHILGTGEHTINDLISGTGTISRLWWVLLLAVVAKTFATASTVKSGGSVGLLFPSMYLGALVGAAAYYLLGEIGLYAGPTVAVYVAAGMAAALTSIAGVPLASIALIVETFGSEYSPPAAVACAVCFTVSRRFSLYVRPPSMERD